MFNKNHLVHLTKSMVEIFRTRNVINEWKYKYLSEYNLVVN
jgi:hypothetical protein